MEKRDLFNRMVFIHDAAFGLIPKPYDGYPYTFVGLLHACDQVLVFCTDETEIARAWKYRELARKAILK